MATSENREKSEESPSKPDDSANEKPKSSPARKLILFLLLVATIVAVGLEYLPEDDSDSDVVGVPARKLGTPAQPPVQPQQQQPAVPQPRKPVPAPTPTPPQYERPPETLFVSNSPSDVPASAAAAAIPAVAGGTPLPAKSPMSPEPTPPAEATVTEAASPQVAPTPVPGTEPSASAAVAAAETPPVTPAPPAPEATATVEAPAEPAMAFAAEAPTPSAEPVAEGAVAAAQTPETAIPTPVSLAPYQDLGATRSPPVPATLPVQTDPELVIVVENSASVSQAVARPLPDGPVPTKVNRYARRLFNRFDNNGDGVIDATERRQMQGNPSAIDYDADGKITLEELAAFTADFGRHRRMRLTGSMVDEAVAELPPLYIPTAERDAMAAAQQAALQAAGQPQEVPVALIDESVESDGESTDETEDEEEGDDTAASQAAPEQVSSKRFVTPQSRLSGLPDWFLAKDANGDGQVTVAEYAPDSQKARLDEFARYDRNGDGVLTAQECPK